MKTILATIVIFTIGYFIYSHFIKYPYRYVGIFYPNAENLNKWVESEPFGSADECREWAEEMADDYIYSLGLAYGGNYDYECGKDCYKGDTYSQGVTYTCKTSVD